MEHFREYVNAPTSDYGKKKVDAWKHLSVSTINSDPQFYIVLRLLGDTASESIKKIMKASKICQPASGRLRITKKSHQVLFKQYSAKETKISTLLQFYNFKLF